MIMTFKLTFSTMVICLQNKQHLEWPKQSLPVYWRKRQHRAVYSSNISQCLGILVCLISQAIFRLYWIFLA